MGSFPNAGRGSIARPARLRGWSVGGSLTTAACPLPRGTTTRWREPAIGVGRPGLTAWFDADAQVREPEDLLETVLERTSRARRRPAWLLPERWIPMQLTMPLRLVPRLAPILLLIVVLLLAAAIAIVAVGSARHLPAPFGPAANGQLAYVSAGQIFTAMPTARAHDRSPQASGPPRLRSGRAMGSGSPTSRRHPRH